MKKYFKCANCGKKNEVTRDKRKFCSLKCYWEYLDKNKKPKLFKEKEISPIIKFKSFGERRNHEIKVKLYSGEKTSISYKASKNGLTSSQFLRMLGLRADFLLRL